MYSDGAAWEGDIKNGMRHGISTFQEKLVMPKVQIKREPVEPEVQVVKHKEKWHYGVLTKRGMNAVATTNPQIEDSKLLEEYLKRKEIPDYYEDENPDDGAESESENGDPDGEHGEAQEVSSPLNGG